MCQSSHLIHGNIGAVRCGRHVAATGHRVLRCLKINLAFQDTFVIDLLLTQTQEEDGETRHVLQTIVHHTLARQRKAKTESTARAPASN